MISESLLAFAKITETSLSAVDVIVTAISAPTEMPQANEDRILGKVILWRVLAMLINEATDALFLNIATKEDIDLAMTKGVNYPKGLLTWADEIGLENVLKQLEKLHTEYGEDRYRPSPLLKQMAATNKTFY